MRFSNSSFFHIPKYMKYIQVEIQLPNVRHRGVETPWCQKHKDVAPFQNGKKSPVLLTLKSLDPPVFSSLSSCNSPKLLSQGVVVSHRYQKQQRILTPQCQKHRRVGTPHGAFDTGSCVPVFSKSHCYAALKATIIKKTVQL